MRTALLIILLLSPQLALAQDDLRVAGEPVYLAGSDTSPLAHPAWSPDGTRLAFTRPGYQGLWILDRRTQAMAQVTDEPAAGFGFSWSPGGTALLARVARFEGPRRLNTIKVFDLATGAARELTPYRAQMPALPRWSPDQAQAYLYSRGALEAFDTGLAPTAGKATADAPLFFAAAARVGAARPGERAVRTVADFEDRDVLNLVPSPDGGRMAFEVMGGGLQVMNADGSGLRDLGPGHRPQWSPDGQWIVFMQTEDDGYQFTASDLYAVRADGSRRVQLTRTPARLEMNPAWSPDGAHIAFDALDEGALYLLPVAR
jgi:Tol biopolymer transport system component